MSYENLRELFAKSPHINPFQLAQSEGVVREANDGVPLSRDEARLHAQQYSEEVIADVRGYSVADYRADMNVLRETLLRVAHRRNATSRYGCEVPLNPSYQDSIGNMRFDAEEIDHDLEAEATGVSADGIIGMLLRIDVMERSQATGTVHVLKRELKKMLISYQSEHRVSVEAS